MARIISTEEYMSLDRPNLDWIIEGQIPHPSLVLLHGPPKSGKSFLAMDLLRCISQGKSFLGWKSHKSKALYLQFDTSEMVWRQRLISMKSSGVDLSGDIYTVHPDDMPIPFNILERGHSDWLRGIVNKSDCKVILIDVFREIHNADENDSTQMKIVGDILMSIFKDRTLILVHHSKKIPDEVINPDPTQVARGSSYLTGKVDALWLLHNKTLAIQSRTSEPVRLQLKQSPSGSWFV